MVLESSVDVSAGGQLEIDRTNIFHPPSVGVAG
jgi:hypothetical protein